MKDVFNQDFKQAYRDGGRSFFGFLGRTNFFIILLLFLFVLTSFYAVSTASGQETYKAIFDTGATPPLIKHFVIVFVSLLVTFLMPLVSAKHLQVWGLSLYFLFCIVLLVLLFTNGARINNAERWVYIMGVSVQPSEFLKLGLVSFVALVSSKFQSRGDECSWGDYRKYYLYPIILILIVSAYIGWSNISTAVIYMTVTACLFFVCKMPWTWFFRTFASLALLAILAFFIIVKVLPDSWLVGRFATLKARTERTELPLVDKDKQIIINDDNLQEQYARIALANSQLLGRGVGQSKIKDSLPMAMSDYVYAVMIEEVGLVALIGIPALYVAWFLLVASMARKEDDLFCKFLLYGIGIMFPFQALINILVVSGAFTTGQPLPFISAGGSSFLANCIAFGVMLMISRWQVERKRQAKRLEL